MTLLKIQDKRLADYKLVNKSKLKYGSLTRGGRTEGQSLSKYLLKPDGDHTREKPFWNCFSSLSSWINWKERNP